MAANEHYLADDEITLIDRASHVTVSRWREECWPVIAVNDNVLRQNEIEIFSIELCVYMQPTDAGQFCAHRSSSMTYVYAIVRTLSNAHVCHEKKWENAIRVGIQMRKKKEETEEEKTKRR